MRSFGLPITNPEIVVQAVVEVDLALLTALRSSPAATDVLGREFGMNHSMTSGRLIRKKSMLPQQRHYPTIFQTQFPKNLRSLLRKLRQEHVLSGEPHLDNLQ